MENSKIKKTILGVSAIAILGIAVVGGGAFAKYITSITGTGTGTIAKWDVTVNPVTITNKEYTASTLSADRIAPGTEGTFDIVVNAGETETAVDYKIEITDTANIPQNMYFMVGNTKCNTLAEVGNVSSGTIEPNDTERTVTKTVKWVWDYETGTTDTDKNANNLKDKADGEAANTMSFNVKVTAEQKTPTPKV